MDKYDFITINEVGTILNVGRNKAYELVRTGAIPAFKIGRTWKITRDAVYKYIESKIQ